ncbi:MAG TPA: rhamnulokinase family protein [Verrucomicrobiae bacterium]|nr:rhamnulokinase family protein [Verrucomicrobiae bacterium]
MHYLACDLGAESGRLMAGTLDRGKLSLQEIHRFENKPLREGASLRWNVQKLLLDLKEGLRRAVNLKLKFESISADSWGVDYVLFDQAGERMEPVYHYRDPRTKWGVEKALAKISWPEIFAESGIQFMAINTIFQLAAEELPRLQKAKFLLGIGDACNFYFSGVPRIEASMASTFQLYNPHLKDWSEKLIAALGFPRALFPKVVASGTRLGQMRPELASELGMAPLEVIATCSHDTGAAVAGIPAVGSDWAYLSSGTWSLMGVELTEPVMNEAARELNFTNEIGYGGSIRFLKNISGLWLIQECRRQWSREGREFDYSTLTQLAQEAPPFICLINPAAPEFLSPVNMPAQFAEFCGRSGQASPSSAGEVVRCALESLALLYRRTLRQLERLTGRRVECLHVVGGGSNNDLLNQMTANAVQLPVLAGPAEATAAGNVLLQGLALGHIASLERARGILKDSMVTRRFEPRDAEEWNRASARFESLCPERSTL